MEKPTNEQKKKDNLKKKVEAILFSVGERLDIENIARLARAKDEDVEQTLKQLQEDYQQKNTSLEIVNDGKYWKLSVHDSYQNVMRKIVTQTELSKTVLETLAVIAFKYPIRQSDLIKIRTNKAYDHLTELEQTGFISRKKYGRTNLIKLTDKFFQYFDLPPDKLKEQFADFQGIARAIEQKEEENEKLKQTKLEEESLEDKEKRIEQEIENLDDTKVEVYTEDPVKDPVRETRKWEVYDASEKPHAEKPGLTQSVSEKERVEAQEKREQEEDHKRQQEQKKEEKKEELLQELQVRREQIKEQMQQEQGTSVDTKPKGVSVSPAMQEDIDKKVDNMLHPPEEEKDEEKELNPLLDRDEVRKKQEEEEETDIFEDVR